MSADTQPRVAVIGCGQWGSNLVRNFHQLGALRAVGDANPETARRMAVECGVDTRGVDDILTADDIDGVVIAAPAKMHAALTEKALSSGKDVFVEKPIALSVEEGWRSIALAEANGRILMVGHLLLHHPVFLKLKELVDDGALGKLQYVYSNRLNLGRIRREENVLFSFAPHDISMILALVGELPGHVRGTGSGYLHPVIEDVATANIVFANGVNAHLFVSWLHPFKEQKLVVIGDRGMAVFDDQSPWAEKLVVYNHRIDWRNGVPQPNRAEGIPIVVDQAEPLRLECRHFLDCMRTRRRPRTDGREALDVLKVLQAAEQSMRTGATVALAAQDPPLVPSLPAPPAKPAVFVHQSSCVDGGADIGEGTKIWHFSHILSGTKIGRNCSIAQNVMIGPDVSVGDNCKIQNNVSLYKGVTLEDGVFCGPSCVFTNVRTPRAEIDRRSEFALTHVERGVTVGANATIVCGVRLGRYSFIAAGAVVTKNVPPFAMMAGAPAGRIGWVGHAGERLDDDLRCPRTGRRYRLVADDALVPVDDGGEEIEPTN